MDLMKLADRSWPVLDKITGLHIAAYRATNGKIGHSAPGLPTMLLLQHVGARSGTRRTTPLLYTRDGENLVLVASKGGYSKHPAWYHNLRAHPDTTVQLKAEILPVHAHVATPEERRRLWPHVVGTYSQYERYQQRTAREIPLVVLEPRRTT
ncbi:nitroreductase family deazaflavin-dependent oxidoreductase [Bounagaea algeriensis]